MSYVNGTKIAVDSLSVRYADREELALGDVSEQIDPGEVVVVSGASGCGKSTLCKALCKFIPEMIPAHVEGEILIDGLSIRNIRSQDIATRLGLVQQDPDSQICTLNVWQEVAFGPENLCLPREEVRARVEESLLAAGISHLVNRETTTLSGGEKQRLAIASILAMRPSVVLLDEPTANLDPQGAKAIFEIMDDLRKNGKHTLIVAEHRLVPLLRMHPRLLLLSRGKVVAHRSSVCHKDLEALGLRADWNLDLPPLPRAEKATLYVDRVSFGYEGISLFEDLSFKLWPGEILGIIGPNGGGKTTLLRLIAGLEKPASGCIARDGDPGVGFIFQQPHQQIFERTVRRELEVDGLIDSEDIPRVLEGARLAGLENAPPLSLSLGEQRRLTFAIALSRNSDLLLLDEPFIGQDAKNVSWIISQLVAARRHGTATVLVSHDIPLVASLCDRLLYLGERTFIGKKDEVLCQLREAGETAFTPTYWEQEQG